jgi:hypothetical protein
LIFSGTVLYFLNDKEDKQMKKKFLLTGFGFMGQTHAWSLINHPNAELIGIIDPCDPFERLSIKGNRATSSVTEKDIRKIPHYTDLTSALSEEIPDGIVVALPTKFHCSAVIEALNAGVNVFVEKPFIDVAPDLEESEKKIKKPWHTGELDTFYHDWLFHERSELIFDCNSGGVPHKHCMDVIVAQKLVGTEV